MPDVSPLPEPGERERQGVTAPIFSHGKWALCFAPEYIGSNSVWKEGKTDVNPYARKSVDTDEVIAEEETETVTEEPVMCL